MSELQSMRVMALHELALAEGVPADAVEDAMDDNDPKTVLIRLVTARRATEPSEVLERDGSVSAVRIGEMLGSGAKAERERAYDLLEACEDGAVAAECVGALTDVLRRKVEEVSAAEWQRAALTLGHLFSQDLMAVGTEWMRQHSRRGLQRHLHQKSILQYTGRFAISCTPSPPNQCLL